MKMAYQTRNRSTRPSPGASQPQIVYLQPNQNNSTPAQSQQHATSYMTTTVNTYSENQQSQSTPLPETVLGAAAAAAAAASADSDAGYEDLLDDTKGDEEESTRPKWMKKRKDPTFKVSKKVRRKRMNAKLRKMLQPKNAIMVLNELKESVKFTFHEQTNAMQQNFFVVTVEVDGQMYTGQGLSKPAAKQNAAENALKALLLEKMAQNAQTAEGDGDVTMKEEPETTLGAPDVPPGEEPPLLDEEGKPMSRQFQQQPEDDVPWGSLASFALFKLFNDWQSQGTPLPLGGKTGNGTAATAAATTAAGAGGATTTGSGSETGFCENRGPAPMKKLPDNPTDRHPVMLLNQLRPSLVFNDVSMQGVPPNVVFTMAVTIDGVAYQGMGKNKKEAKKEAAKAALAAVFNIHYDN